MRGKGSIGTRVSEAASAYGFLLPTFLGIVLFSLVPLLLTMINSFFNSGFYQKAKFVGLGNYANVLGDRYFFNSILVGFKFTLLVVPIQIVAAFLFAHMLKSLGRGVAGFVKTAIIVPTVISGVIASLVFVFIFDYQGGLLNNLLKLFGVPLQAWFADRKLALLSISLPRIWLGFGYITLFMLGGLLEVPETYYEAARIDGAGPIRQMLRITIPSMSNIILFLLVSGVVAAMQEFDLPYNMTGGGPARSTETPALFVYTHFIRDTTVGYSLAAAMMITLVLGALSAIVFRTINAEKSLE